MKQLAAAALLSAACLLAGCDRAVVVRGKVTDIKGETLPGVAVTVKGTDRQRITNVLGEYALPSPPGEQILQFAKTGYTPTELPLQVPGMGPVEAGALIQLWPLPDSQGVFIFEDFRYRPLTRTEPTRYTDPANGGPVFGTTKKIDAYTSDTTPTLLAHRLYDYDLALHRMEEREVAEAQSPDGKQRWKVWVPVERIPVLPAAIDEPEHLLLEVTLSRPLEYGVYAVHWGALEGHISTHRRVYLFNVVEHMPEPEPLLPAETESLGEGEGAAAEEPPPAPAPAEVPADVAPPEENAPGYDDLSG